MLFGFWYSQRGTDKPIASQPASKPPLPGSVHDPGRGGRSPAVREEYSCCGSPRTQSAALIASIDDAKSASRPAPPPASHLQHGGLEVSLAAGNRVERDAHQRRKRRSSCGGKRRMEARPRRRAGVRQLGIGLAEVNVPVRRLHTGAGVQSSARSQRRDLRAVLSARPFVPDGHGGATDGRSPLDR